MAFKETTRYKLDYAEGPTLVSEYPTVDSNKSKLLDEVVNELQDIIQAGVVSSADWSFTAKVIEVTGELESEGEVAASLAWLPDPTENKKLMRSKSSKAAISAKKPAELPAETKYMPIAFELTASTWNAAPTVSLHSGTERATLKEAEEKPPSATAGKSQIRLVVLKNTGGKYKIEHQEDARSFITAAPPAPTILREEGVIAIKNGESIQVQKNGATVSLPASTANGSVLIWCWAEGTGSCKVKTTGGAKIYGDFVSAVEEVALETGQHLLLHNNGVNWIIVAGEAKREQTYTEKTFTKAEAEAGVEPSASRSAWVIAGPSSAGEFGAGNGPRVEGKLLPNSSVVKSIGFYVPPGQKWTAKVETTTSTLLL